MVPWMQCNSSSSVFTCWGTCECVHVHTQCTDKSPPHPLASPVVAHVNVCVCMHNADSSPSCLLSSHIVAYVCSLAHTVHGQICTPSSILTCSGAHVSVCTCTHGARTDLHSVFYAHMLWEHMWVCALAHTVLHPILYSHTLWGACECMHLYTQCIDRSPLCITLVPAHFRAVSSEPLSLACFIPHLICISADSTRTCCSYFALSRFSSEPKICQVFLETLSQNHWNSELLAFLPSCHKDALQHHLGNRTWHFPVEFPHFRSLLLPALQIPSYFCGEHSSVAP